MHEFHIFLHLWEQQTVTASKTLCQKAQFKMSPDRQLPPIKEHPEKSQVNAASLASYLHSRECLVPTPLAHEGRGGNLALISFKLNNCSILRVLSPLSIAGGKQVEHHFFCPTTSVRLFSGSE